MNKDELYHYGILGMKWGIQRNLARAIFGKRRRDNDDYEVPPHTVQRSSTSSGSSTSGGARRLEDMTDAELKERIDRLSMEQKYTAMVNSKLSSGQKRLRSVLDTSGNVLSTGSSIVNTALAMKKASGQPTGKLDKTKSYVDATSNIVKESKNINTKLSESKAKIRPGELDYMDDQMVRDKVNRWNMEQQYKTITAGQIERGKVDVKKIIEVAGSVVAITGSIVSIAVAIKGAMGGGTPKADIPKPPKIPAGIKGV